MPDLALTHDLLARMAARTCAAVPDRGLVFFGLRGALPLDIGGTAFAASHGIRLTGFDHLHMRCTLGQWRPADRKLALFPGSTVPHRNAVSKARERGGIGANMLMLGRYKYQKGMHRAASRDGHRAFRQAMFFPVWRTADDLDFDLQDRIDLGDDSDSFVFDNLHCAFQDNIDAERFSSNGCQVVAGAPMSKRRNNMPETGPWARFIGNAYGADANGQTQFVYLLFSGAEAAMLKEKAGQPVSRSARFGSSGEWVERVQTALQGKGFDFLEVDGDFGRDTLQAVKAFQRRQFGPGTVDGIVGPNTAAALGIDWQPLAAEALGAAAGVATAPEVAAAVATAPEVTTVPPDWHRSAVAITGGFENSGDPYQGVSGDFDLMGISCGVLQWNIGKGSLQPMVVAVGRDVVEAAMPTLGGQLWNACNAPLNAALATVRSWQSGTRLKPAAAGELRALMGSSEMRAEQDRRIGKIMERALKLANDWAQSGGRAGASKREFVWFFDLVTQNGSLAGVTRRQVSDFIEINRPDRVDDAVCNFLAAVGGSSGHVRDANKNAALWRNRGDEEQVELLVLSFLRSGLSNPKWRHVVLNRKGTIAEGEGFVNGKRHDLSGHQL